MNIFHEQKKNTEEFPIHTQHLTCLESKLSELEQQMVQGNYPETAIAKIDKIMAESEELRKLLHLAEYYHKTSWSTRQWLLAGIIAIVLSILAFVLLKM